MISHDLTNSNRDTVTHVTTPHKKTSHTRKVSDASHVTTQKIERDKVQEVEYLYNIMRPIAKKQGRNYAIVVPHEDGTPLHFVLSITKREGTQAHAWVFNEYSRLYPTLHSPLLGSYKDAIFKVLATLEITGKRCTSTDEKQGHYKSNDEERNEHVLSSADWTCDAIDVRVTYARVRKVVIHEGASLQGLWRVDGHKTKRLTNACLEVLRVERPHSDNKHARYRSVTLRFIDSQGEVKDITVTDEQMLGNDLSNKLIGFASYPEQDVEKKYFAECIAHLAPKEGTVQDKTETLGWQNTSSGKLVWSMVNGCETVQGFTPRENAPFLTPDIPSTQHGYYGKAITPDMLNLDKGDWWDLRLRQYALHPDVQAWQLASIGLSALVMLPDGITPDGIGLTDGRVRFSPDLVGAPESGKSREINNMLTAFGTRFLWNTSPLLTLGKSGKADTMPGRGSTMAMMKHHLFADGDYKASPTAKEYEALHELRNATVTSYADGDDGGKKKTRTGATIERDAPSGCAIRTCNYDHALTSIEKGEAMIERRACTFVWPKGIKGNDGISRLLDSTRLQGYATWQAYRKWVMQKVEMGREDFISLVSVLNDMALSMVSESGTKEYEWGFTEHRNHAQLIVLGVLLFQEFLQETRPDYWLRSWVEEHTNTLIENRIKRSQYLVELMNSHEEDAGIETLVLNTLRYLLSNASLYVRTQQDGLVNIADLGDVPYGMKDIGYRSVIRDSVETWEAGRQCIGHLVHKDADIALITDLLMEVLRREGGKKNIPIDTEKHLLNLLAEKGIIIPDIDKSTGKVKRSKQLANIGGKVGRYAVMPVLVLFPRESSIDVEDYEDIDVESTPDNIIPLHAHKPTSSTDTRAIVNGVPLTQEYHEQTLNYDPFNVDENSIEEN